MTVVRAAEKADVPKILELIRELAVYEREPDAVKADTEDLMAALFPPTDPPLAHCLVAESEGGVRGIALWYVTYSTWEGRHGLHVEDLYVSTRFRGRGLGRALLAELAAETVRRDYARLEWSVLDWNAPARHFYEAIGGQPMEEWIPYRISGQPLRALAGNRAEVSKGTDDFRQPDLGNQ